MKKSLVFIVAAILMLSACQPTLEQEIVISKDDGHLDALIQATAAMQRKQSTLTRLNMD